MVAYPGAGPSGAGVADALLGLVCYLAGVDGENCDDDEDAGESSYGMIKKVRSADNGNMKIMRKAIRLFFKLVSDHSISEFLKRDACCLISDKVLSPTGTGRKNNPN